MAGISGFPRRSVVIAALISVSMGLGLANPARTPSAWGQPPGEVKVNGSKKTIKKKGGTPPAEKAKKRSIIMNEMEIFGEVEKPNAMFVIPRAPGKYSRQEHKKDFTDQILSPISKEWIEDREKWQAVTGEP